MSRQCSTPPVPFQFETIVKKRRGSSKSMSDHATGCKLDCKRQSIEISTNFASDQCIVVAQFDTASPRSSPLDKQLHCRKSHSFFGGQARIFDRAFQRSQPINMLSFNAERLPACCQNIHSRRLAEYPFGQGRDCFDHMLAIVEQKKTLSTGQACYQRSGRITSLYAQAKH